MTPILGSTAPVITGISCPAAGDCTAVGLDFASPAEIFVVQEASGSWGTAGPLPGTPVNIAADSHPTATIACAAPGSCVVAGSYAIAQGQPGESGPQHVFVADEANGTWRKPADLPGLHIANPGAGASVSALSCPSPGYCALGGTYYPASAGQGYVASEVNGTWGTAIQVPGAAALTTAAGSMTVDALSCSAPGDCIAAGSYRTVVASDAPEHAVIVTESGGVWSDAVPVPGMQSLPAIDCPDAGDCVAGGTDAQGNAAIVREVQRRWGSPAEIPGTRTLAFAGKQASSTVTALACPTAGTCAAGGEYILGGAAALDSAQDPQTQVFLAGEVRGTWDTARVPAGMATLSTGANAILAGLACAAPGNCAAGVDHTAAQFGLGAYVMAELPAG
jgi:hypothetical protein